MGWSGLFGKFTGGVAPELEGQSMTSRDCPMSVLERYRERLQRRPGAMAAIADDARRRVIPGVMRELLAEYRSARTGGRRGADLRLWRSRRGREKEERPVVPEQ
jgi:hypothetical protein